MLPFDTTSIPNKNGTYLVGGSVRDALLGRAATDFDIAVSHPPEKFARQFAKNTGGHLVKLGKPGKMIYRVVSKDSFFDISPVNGSSIQEDLGKRDFTINAMAHSLSSGELIDPFGGRRDLVSKTIRMVAPTLFDGDPVRLMRAYRMEAVLGFAIEPETVSVIKKDASKITESAGERIRDELFKILAVARSHGVISRMGSAGLLQSVFPELGTLMGCTQNRYHQYDVFNHTLHALAHLENLLIDPSQILPGSSKLLKITLDETEKRNLKLAMLLHDIGKPSTRTVDEKGNVHFYGHGRRSAEMAVKTGYRLRLSTQDLRFTDFVIRHHIRPLYLFFAHQKNTLTKKGKTRFFLKCGGYTPFLLMHTIADIRGKGTRKDPRNNLFYEFALELLREYTESFRAASSRPPLINGHDLMDEFQLKPSPLFKKILNRIEASRLAGEIKTRQSALRLAEKLLKQEETNP